MCSPIRSVYVHDIVDGHSVLVDPQSYVPDVVDIYPCHTASTTHVHDFVCSHSPFVDSHSSSNFLYGPVLLYDCHHFHLLTIGVSDHVISHLPFVSSSHDT